MFEPSYRGSDARPVNDRRSQMIINDFLTKELHTQALFVNFQLVSTDIIIVMSHTVWLIQYDWLPEQYQSDNDGKSSDSESSVESASRIARPTAFQSSQLRGRQSELENERRNTKQTLRTSLAGCEVNERLVNKFGSVKYRWISDNFSKFRWFPIISEISLSSAISNRQPH